MYKQNRKTMKNLLTLTFIFTLFLGFHSVQAEVIIVNNNTGQPADHASLQAAINAAKDGDILYLVGSPDTYETVTIKDKYLTIIGPGYFLGANEDINTQASNETAKIHQLFIEGEKASNTVITGIDANQSIFSSITVKQGNSQNSPQNVKITRNIINEVIIGSAKSTIIKENYIGEITLNKGASNTIIWNNIIVANISESIFSDGLSGTYIKNNTLLNGLNKVHNAKVENNIFISGGLAGCFNNTVQHNVFTIVESNVFPEEPNSNTYKNKGNRFGEPASSLFISNNRKLDSDYQLNRENEPLSRAIEAGIDEVDAGAFLEQDPDNSYKISGLPAYPAIYELKTNGVGTANDGMKVTIKAKSHN